MNKFEEYKLDLSKKDKKMINDYLENIKKFIKENNQEEEMYYDIEERVFEKLSTYKKLNQLKIKQTLNEIWEPEDIFEIEQDSTNFIKQKLGFVGKKVKLLKNHKFLVSFIIMLFIWLIFDAWEEYFVTIFVIGWIILSYYLYNDYKEKSNWKISFIWWIRFITWKTKDITFSFFKLLKRLFIYIFWLSKKILLFSIKSLSKLFKLLFSVFWYSVLWVSIIMLCIIPILLSWFKIWGIDYISVIPRELIISYLLLCVTIATLWVYMIIRKIFLIHFIIIWISFVLVFSFAFLWWTKVYNKHSYEGKVTQKYTIESEDKDLTINSSDIDIYWKMYLFGEFAEDYKINILASQSGAIELEVITKIFTEDNDKLKEIEEKLNDFEVSIKWNDLIIWLKDWEIYKEKQDFIPMIRSLDLYIPKDMLIDFKWFWYYNFKKEELRKCIKWYHDNNLKVLNIDWKINCLEEKEEEILDSISENLVNKIDPRNKAIEEYLLSQKQFSWETELWSSRSCVFEVLDKDKELFPLSIWSYCIEYKIENTQYIELSWSSGPVLINYPNELSYFRLENFSHKSPRDWNLYWNDIKELFSEEAEKQIYSKTFIDDLKEKVEKDVTSWLFMNVRNVSEINSLLISKDKLGSFEISKVLEQSCELERQCMLPMDYAIRSNCPYTMKCIENKCSVICPRF